MDILIFIGLLGLITGFISGLLGIGGGILMAPLLLYMPPLFGFAPLTMHTVAGLTIVQGLFACGAGGLTHKKFPYFSGQLVGWMGIVLFIASFTGGMVSSITANEMLLVIFAIMALTASVVILLPRKTDVEYPDIADFKFNRFRAVSVAGSVGILGGLVGQGGSFILIPLMTYYMKVPTRIAIGSNLTIVFLSSLAAFLGKAVSSQIDWMLAFPIVMSVVPGACMGAYVSQKVPVRKLRTILAFCIAIAAFRISFSAVGY